MEEVARTLRVTTKTVRRWIKAGLLVAHRIGSKVVRVDASSVTRLIEASRIGASPGDQTWQGGSERSTSAEPHTSSGSAERPRSGPRSSTAARSRSAPPTPSRPSVDSSSWPKNASELREHLRRLRRPS
ncbi:helix-turn-helix domain-containing protein [Polyangium spumosum]|uniref:helix-turn-helix domain-containing protein n=1 Tax=Polyangium spumosum TaxID=889282 RepID=UPI003B83A562